MSSNPPSPSAAGSLALECAAVVKTYGGVRALRGIDLAVPAGSVEALVGQNGAGKSTLIGILAGRVAATSGSVKIFGQEPAPGDPRASRAAGLVTIYQELTLVPGLTAEENVFLGMAPSARGVIDKRTIRRRYLEFGERLGVSIPPRTPARDLSVADGQVLEIMRALVAEARVILLDEPTAALAASERDALLGLVRELRAQGVTVIYISHNLGEVLEIADHVTVLRDGAVAGQGPIADWDERRLVATMLGGKADGLARQMLDHGTRHPAARHRPAEPVGAEDELLAARGVTLEGAIEGIDLVVRRGEILGLGGLVGSGRSTLLRCLAGAEPESRGELRIGGEPVPWPRSVRRGLRNGVALIPEDRKHDGLVLGMSAMDNIALPALGSTARFGWLSNRRLTSHIAEFASEFGFDAERLGAEASNLSGGNQQKLLLARWRYHPPKILLADEPTRGIDVGAKEEILRSLRRFAESGVGIIIVSSELEEVSMVADRVLVLADGRVVAELERAGGPIPVPDILGAAYSGSLRRPAAEVPAAPSLGATS